MFWVSFLDILRAGGLIDSHTHFFCQSLGSRVSVREPELSCWSATVCFLITLTGPEMSFSGKHLPIACDSPGRVLSNTSPNVFSSDQMIFISYALNLPLPCHSEPLFMWMAVELTFVAYSKGSLTISLPGAEVPWQAASEERGRETECTETEGV